MSIHAPTRIRFDDFLWKSSDPKLDGKELQKFTKNVNWCINTNVVLTPAVLCQDLDQFPDAVEWCKRMAQEGAIYPDLHGWDHGPYAPRSQAEIEEHLDKASEWFMSKLGLPPVRWITPHGADSHAIRDAAAKYSLIVETCESPVVDQKVLDPMLRETWDLSVLDGKVIMNHWWERGLRLYRIARIIENQSIEGAIEATLKELSMRDHKICWDGWSKGEVAG